MKKIVVIGGGAAGMATALFASEMSGKVILLEQNEKLGKKLYITGKGRCNFTNACEPDEFLSHVITNPRFLFSAFQGFTNHDMIALVERLGVRTKVERGNRAFPKSDHSSDLIRAMEKKLHENGVEIRLHTRASELLTEPVDLVGATGNENASVSSATHSVDTSKLCSQKNSGKKKKLVRSERIIGVRLADGTTLAADQVVIATGGLSYPSTGATGDGFRFAKAHQMEVTKLRPALVPLLTKETYIPRLQGLSLRNVELTLKYGKKRFSEFGEMLFTHEGITGPLVLAASSVIGAALESGPVEGSIDLKPALSVEQLDARLLREFEAEKNKAVKNVIGGLFPTKLRPIMLEIAQLDPDKPVHAVTKAERMHLIEKIKAFPLTVTGAGQFKEAVITQGGISVKEINPKTMESKRIGGLYCVGEVLDLDAVTGGYNLQIAWSTAYACAKVMTEGI